LSAQRFDELPKLDRFLRTGAVPVISVSFALRRATASAASGRPANLAPLVHDKAIALTRAETIANYFVLAPCDFRVRKLTWQ
jgi:hypothetical protein